MWLICACALHRTWIWRSDTARWALKNKVVSQLIQWLIESYWWFPCMVMTTGDEDQTGCCLQEDWWLLIRIFFKFLRPIDSGRIGTREYERYLQVPFERLCDECQCVNCYSQLQYDAIFGFSNVHYTLNFLSRCRLLWVIERKCGPAHSWP